EGLELIVRMHVKALAEQVREQHQSRLIVDDDAVRLLAELAYDPAYGARPVERTLDKRVLSDLSRAIIAGHVTRGSTVRVARIGDDVEVFAGSEEEIAAEIDQARAEVAAPAVEAES